MPPRSAGWSLNWRARNAEPPHDAISGLTTEQAGPEVETAIIRIPMRLQRRGGRKLIMTPEGAPAAQRQPARDETIIEALVKAHRLRRRIENGQARSITDVAERESVTTPTSAGSCR